MRILWLTPGFAADETDLNCIPPLQLLARDVSGKGIDLTIITIEYPFTATPYTWHGIPVFSGYGWNRNWLTWFNWLRVMRRAEQLHREKPFDLMHSFWLGPAWVIGNRLAATWHIPHLTTLMGQDVLPSNRYLKLLRPRHAPHLIALSPFHHGIFKQTTGQQVEHIIPWGVDDIATQQINPSERPIDVLGCGSLIPVKQWDKWMEVVAGLVRKYPGLRAELVGEGPQRKALENKIRELNLGAHVVLTGALPRPQVLTKMQAARVLLHTAAFESFGFVIAEAAMSGCRIVSTPVGVAPELGDCAEDVETLEGLVEGALQGAVREQRTPPCRMDEIGEQYLGLWKGRVV